MNHARPGDPVLSLRSISRGFGGVQALADVSLDVHSGQVHCLAGENGSGKSTLIKIVAGVLRPHGGTIQVAGRTFSHLTPTTAVNLGIQVIYQDLSLFPNLTVAENLSLNTLIEHRAWLVRRKTMRDIGTRAMEHLGLSLDLDRPVGGLPIAQRQLVAIARALLQDARLVILDEPTTALTSVEVDALFGLVRTLTSQGVAMLFVSHKLREMFQVSDRFTVLRNGRVVESGPAVEFDESRLSRAMTGRTLGVAPARPARDAHAAPVLRVSRLEGRTLRGVSLELGAGEVVGCTGLLGAGQGELALVLAGAAPALAGEIEVAGVGRRIRSVRDAVRAGIAYVPEDRLSQGLFLDQSVAQNVSASSLRRLRSAAGWLSTRRIDAEAARWADELGVRAPSLRAPVRTLSGGNQQRVVLSKWLATAPRVFVLNGPTVGVDVGAKEAIHSTIRRLAERGMGVVMVSDDLAELAEHCTRVLVFRQGAVADELSGDALTEDALLSRLTLPQ